MKRPQTSSGRAETDRVAKPRRQVALKVKVLDAPPLSVAVRPEKERPPQVKMSEMTFTCLFNCTVCSLHSVRLSAICRRNILLFLKKKNLHIFGTKVATLHRKRRAKSVRFEFYPADFHRICFNRLIKSFAAVCRQVKSGSSAAGN